MEPDYNDANEKYEVADQYFFLYNTYFSFTTLYI